MADEPKVKNMIDSAAREIRATAAYDSEDKPRDAAIRAHDEARHFENHGTYSQAELLGCTVLRSKVTDFVYVLHHNSLKVFRSVTAGSNKLMGWRLQEVIVQDRAWLYKALETTVFDGVEFIKKEKGMLTDEKSPGPNTQVAVATPAPALPTWERPKVATKKVVLHERSTELNLYQLQKALAAVGVEVPNGSLSGMILDTSKDGVLSIAWSERTETSEVV